MDEKQLKKWKCLNLIAVIYAIVAIWLGEYLFSSFFNMEFNMIDEVQPRIIRTILVYIPFGILLLISLIKIKAKKGGDLYKRFLGAYTVGMITSILLWGYYFYEGYAYIAYEKTGGANIGLGILLLFSPCFILVLMGLGYLLFKGRGNH